MNREEDSCPGLELKSCAETIARTGVAAAANCQRVVMPMIFGNVRTLLTIAATTQVQVQSLQQPDPRQHLAPAAQLKFTIVPNWTMLFNTTGGQTCSIAKPTNKTLCI